jgi:hypothetical protein
MNLVIKKLKETPNYVLHINDHVLKRSTGRHDFLISPTEFFKEKSAVLFYGLESKEDIVDFVKPMIMYKNKLFAVRIFEIKGILHMKLLTTLSDVQFFSSLNLNFGMHTDAVEIRFSDTIFEDANFPVESSVNLDFKKLDWKYNIKKDYKKGYDKEIVINGRRKSNYFLREKMTFPFYVFTFWGKRLKISRPFKKKSSNKET